MTKIEGSGSESGSISRRHGSADPDPDPDPPQNVMDSQHCFLHLLGDLLQRTCKTETAETEPFTILSGSATVALAVRIFFKARQVWLIFLRHVLLIVLCSGSVTF
jgi:hypothetical protein